MKNFFSILISSILVIVFIIIGSSTKLETVNVESDDILRIHIRANSNSDSDQKIKYQVKDLLLEYISDDIIKLKTKQEVENYFISNREEIEYLINTFLKNNSFNYGSKITIANEYFPTRVYGNQVVNSGYYDAVILSLGETMGENWWCIAYPTLCFEDYQNFSKDVVYKSRLMDIINKILK